MADEVSTKGLHCNIDRTTLKSYESVLKGSLTGKHYYEDLVDDILHAWCCVSGILEWKLDEDARCDLLYYLAGAIIYDKIQDKGEFATIMNGIPKALKTNFINLRECSIEPKNGGKKFFAEMKLIGNYKLEPGEARDRQEGSGKVSCEKCKKYLEEVMQAYGIVKDYCNLPANKGNCVGVEEGYRKKNPEELYGSMYKIKELPKPTLLVQRKQLEDCQEEENLPSERIYCEFGHTEQQCNDAGGEDTTTLESSLTTIIKKYDGVEDYEEGTINAYCHALKKKNEQQQSPKIEYCPYLYYWIGDTLLANSNKRNEFSTAMYAVYEQLNKLNTNDKCNVIYPNITWDIFDHMKLIFDYYHDYTTIKECIQVSGSPRSKCTQVNEDYLEKVVSAYRSMSAECQGGNNNKWCQEFGKMTAKHTYDELLQLKCSLKHTSECPTSIAPAAVSGTLATTVGIGTFAFFLYKYDLLPSWIRNHFGKQFKGRSSKKRFAQRNFDVSTDDSTTDNSTMDNSTIESLTEYSVPPPSNRRGGANNNGRKQQNRKNISYGRM